MKIIFTICSNNYLAQALVLWKSVQLHEPAATFIIGLIDEKQEAIDYHSFGCEVLEAKSIEATITELAKKYNIIELNTCLKPRYFQYFFENRNAKQVIYLDPDICLYHPLQQMDAHLLEHDFVITPHTLSPIPLDGHTPQENLFLNYGLYNLGFLAVKKSEQVMQFIEWWKDRTYHNGYDKPAIGLFTDQLWINLVPVYFNKVAILTNPAYNMAPWNLHERQLDTEKGYFRVNGEYPLAFFHFSSIHPAVMKLHKEYTRFQWADRPDLHELYTTYQQALENKNYSRYINYPCYYVALRKDYLNELKLLQQRQEAAAYADLPFHIKITRQLKRIIPRPLKQLTLNLIKT